MEGREEVVEAEERVDASSALLFGRLDFRVTRVMILVAAAGSRSEPSRNIDPRHGDVQVARGGENTARSNRWIRSRESEREEDGDRQNGRWKIRDEKEESRERSGKRDDGRFTRIECLYRYIHDRYLHKCLYRYIHGENSIYIVKII